MISTADRYPAKTYSQTNSISCRRDHVLFLKGRRRSGVGFISRRILRDRRRDRSVGVSEQENHCGPHGAELYRSRNYS
jgi:hypothetical protein